MLNECVYSAMNQGLIITIFDDVNSVWFLNEKDAAGYPEDFLEQISQNDLKEIGGEFCYSISPYTRENPDQVVFAAS